MQRLRGLVAACAVGTPLAVFLWFWLHAPVQFAALAGSLVGLAVFLVVATRSDARDAAADVAWLELAPDLPPASERAALEKLQVDMPGPDRQRKASTGPAGRSGGNGRQIAARRESKPK